MKTGNAGLFLRALRRLNLPEEVDLSVPKCTLVGRNNLLVENHAGIRAYDATEVLLSTKEGTLRVTGDALVLREFGGEHVEIRGKVNGVAYED